MVQLLDLTQEKFYSCVYANNSYCSVYQRAMKRNEEPRSHKLEKSPTGMETDGILEGFSSSINMHELKYNKLIGRYY